MKLILNYKHSSIQYNEALFSKEQEIYFNYKNPYVNREIVGY